MQTTFAKLIPGQLFAWNAQTFLKIFPINGLNASEINSLNSFGRFEDDVVVEARDEQLKQNLILTIDPVTVGRSLLDDLTNDSAMLSFLEEEGVDNWEGYSEARKKYKKWYKEADELSQQN